MDEKPFTKRIPKWPYEQWSIDTEVIPHIIKEDNILKKNSAVAKLLNELSLQTEVLADATNAAVYKEMTALMDMVTDDLKKTNQIFECCRLIQAGSFAEETKVGKADEFDYLLVLDFFGNKKLFNLSIDENFYQLFIKDKSKIECPDLVHFMDQQVFIDSNVRAPLLEIFLKVFDDKLKLKPGWKRLPQDYRNYCSSTAATFHLFTESYKMNIDIDICLCFQLTQEDLIKAAQEEQENLYFTYLRCLHQKSPFEVFALIGQAEESLTRTKISTALNELSVFRYYGSCDGRLKTYKFAKCLVCNFLPKYSTNFECERCWRLLISSYTLKNIVLFMIKNYVDNKYWVDDAICTRVVEVFSILNHCIKEKPYDSATISLCILPGNLKLQCIPTINPLLDLPLCLDPKYKIKLPAYHNQLRTGNPEMDCHIKTWFRSLNGTHMSSYDVIEKFESFLKWPGGHSMN